ncbi:hypothetical protein H6F88_15080 [Oculatella sp. FACHB-28]|uniref:hypothetical protein n=1 Tax=Cyanophyceae TaxID=3028117 RepID=UPI00168A2DE4|nr:MULTISPECIES: hypothetical protein [Cyanophyceae]MBD2057325.1 hypothetical protein [Oculatella sp. FACHB-28]MBD2067854.1 hypothetical protein [Leptolyngbya sp. FACHB-671]
MLQSFYSVRWKQRYLESSLWLDLPFFNPDSLIHLNKWTDEAQPILQEAISRDIWQFGILHREQKQIE